ncbi:MAG: DNA-3-methyladenine glycosylase [Pigmentiphaga sp.]|nr:DNA-3-methyladenine glycosylase [Pigmentiphaga sp.]
MSINAKPDYWEEARAVLRERDRVLNRLIPEESGSFLLSRGDPFCTLARAVVGQQISLKAADAIWQRCEAACGPVMTPVSLQRVGVEGLRKAGLSQRKAEYLYDLANHFVSEQVHPALWSDMDDLSIVSELTAIRGIGRWTADMFLIFNLRRPDVLPLDDLGLLRAISHHYFSGEPVSRFEAREVAQAWSPWCTVATWYLWRSLDPVSVEY